MGRLKKSGVEYTLVTGKANKELHQKIRIKALTEDKLVKDVVTEILEEYFGIKK